MKKIFMASICAIMAVTAANADIASTTYVDGAIGGLDQNNTGTVGKYVFTVDTENGIAVPELKDFDPSVTDDSTSVNAPTTQAVATYVKGKLELVTGDEGISGLRAQIEEMDGETTGEGVVKSVTQTAGKVTATAEKIVNADIADNASIAKSKLASDVQTSLGKADNAVARSQVGMADTFAISEACKAKDVVCSLTIKGTGTGAVAQWEIVR